MFAASPPEYATKSHEDDKADNLKDESGLHDVQSLLLEAEIVCHRNHDTSASLKE